MTDEEKLEKLIDAAKKEDWKTVDDMIRDDPAVTQHPYFYEQAFERISDKDHPEPDPNVRDLAASIIEAAAIPADVFGNMRDVLGGMAEHDKHPYARFRAAFALANHGPGMYLGVTRSALEDAQRDPDRSVVQKATAYLSKINQARRVAR